MVIALALHDQLPVFQQVPCFEVCCQAFLDVQDSFCRLFAGQQFTEASIVLVESFNQFIEFLDVQLVDILRSDLIKLFTLYLTSQCCRIAFKPCSGLQGLHHVRSQVVELLAGFLRNIHACKHTVYIIDTA